MLEKIEIVLTPAARDLKKKKPLHAGLQAALRETAAIVAVATDSYHNTTTHRGIISEAYLRQKLPKLLQGTKQARIYIRAYPHREEGRNKFTVVLEMVLHPADKRKRYTHKDIFFAEDGGQMF